MKPSKCWKLWAESVPPRPGYYWLAGYNPEFNEELQDLTVWEVDKDDITGEYPVSNIIGYEPKYLMWSGPLQPPEFKP